ncbi:conserved hypothetical protein [Ricinus communis]|uniref:Uncharacterized protein n=1 Tax=Ricinus communis TaxID=3988 RepID=B9T0B1_RICCO|nr:conserved hypothetical protein [Ricinus communis]
MLVLALPTSWVVGGERAEAGTQGETEWAGTSGLVSKPIGQMTTTSFIRLVLAAYPGMKWDERSFLSLSSTII